MEQAQVEPAQAPDHEDYVKQAGDDEHSPSEEAAMPLFIFRSLTSPDLAADRHSERARQTTAARSAPASKQEAVLRWADAPTSEAEPNDRLTPHGVACLRHVLSEYRTFPREGKDPALCLYPNLQAIAVLEQFSQRPHTAPATWEDLDRLELALLWVTPPAILHHQAPYVRARYEQALNAGAVLRYAPSPSAEARDDDSDKRLRADLEVLLNETQKQRALSHAQARTRSAVARASALWCLRLFLIGLLGFLAARLLPLPRELREVFPLGLAILVGAIGGLASLMGGPKMDRAPGEGIASLSPVVPVRGALLAALFYCLLAGTGGGDWPFGLPGAVVPPPASVARLIVWAFLAGLAPRYLSLLIQAAPKWLPQRGRQKPSGIAPTDTGG